MSDDLNNRPSRAGLSDQDLWLCLIEAEQRTANTDLPMDVRIRSFQTYNLCLHVAKNRGLDYVSLRQRCETMSAEGGRTEQRSAP